ncbi:MAG: hypothetical protein ACK5OX_19230 [Desertimonas sp.]
MESAVRPRNRRRRWWSSAVVLAAVVLFAAAPAAAQDGDRGADPLPEVGTDRISISLSNTSVEPGGQVSFTGSGFINDCGAGQTVTVKLNDIDILGTATARADGSLSGSVTIPPAVQSLGYPRYWLRFLVGTGANACNGADQPIGSLFREFTLTVPAGQDTTTTAAGSSAVIAADVEGATTTTVAGGTSALPNNGFDEWAAMRPVVMLGVVGIGALALQRRLRRA